MKTIPRRLVYRVLAQVVHGQARTVAGRTVGRSLEQANELTCRLHNPIYSRGPGVDPALSGWLTALAIGHTAARAEIARFAHPDVTEGLDWLDMPAVLDRILPRDREEGSPIYD